jgi:hypothetical protein
MRYSILAELPTVVALTIVEPINENIMRKLNRVAAESMFKKRRSAMRFQPINGVTQRKPMMMTTQISITPTG